MEQLRQLTEQNAVMAARLAAAEAAAQTQQQTVAALQQLPATLAMALNQARGDSKKTLIDNKGLGKPSVYDNDEKNFLKWARRTTNFMSSVYKGLTPILQQAVDQDEAIAWHVFSNSIIDVNNEDLEDMNDQIYHCLMALTDGESFDLVVGSGEGQGFEAWRKLNRRWDPVTAGRSKNLLKGILNPGKAKLSELAGAVDRLEDLMRRYCSRRKPDGSMATLDDDIRMAALEAMLPDALENHVQLNRARLDTYAKLRAEIMLYTEAKAGTAMKEGTRVSQGYGDGGGQAPMDVDSFQQKGKYGKGKGDYKGGKGKGDYKGGKGRDDHKGKSKGDGGKGSSASKKPCFICGKLGHMWRDCWSKDDPKFKREREAAEAMSKGSRGASGSGKSQKGGKGTKGANSLDVEPEAELHVDALDLCAFDSRRPEIVDGWLKVNFDSGTARTVFPMEADYGEKLGKKVSMAGGLTFKTATGEIVPDGGAIYVKGKNESSEDLGLNGFRAPVHKPLASAEQMVSKGQDVWLSDDYSCILHKGSAVHAEVRAAVRAILQKHSNGTTTLHRERGVFNFYLSGAGGGKSLDICSGEQRRDNP